MRLRFPRFGLRVLLVAMALLAGFFGWVANAIAQRANVAALKAANPSVEVYYGDELAAGGEPLCSLGQAGLYGFLRARLGKDFVDAPARVDMMYATDADLEYLVRLKGIRWVRITRGVDVTDVGLARIAQLKNLAGVTVDSAYSVTERGIAELARLPHVTSQIDRN